MPILIRELEERASWAMTRAVNEDINAPPGPDRLFYKTLQIIIRLV